jgi:hypothetical protein
MRGFNLEVKEKIKKYKKQSIHYFENAIKFIDKGDAEKASEFLWGSVAQALKAVAASKNIWLRSHNQIKNYALELARELHDDSIRHTFDYAQSLHSNFYESGLLLEDVARAAEDVKKTAKQLLSLVPD